MQAHGVNDVSVVWVILHVICLSGFALTIHLECCTRPTTRHTLLSDENGNLNISNRYFNTRGPYHLVSTLQLCTNPHKYTCIVLLYNSSISCCNNCDLTHFSINSREKRQYTEREYTFSKKKGIITFSMRMRR